MFIGHYGVAFAAKRGSPQVSLGTLILASQLPDLLWPVFLLLGLEHVRIDPGNTAACPLDFYDYPITHSLLGTLGWAVALGLLYYGLRRSAKAAWVVGACVVSHWLLDGLVHRPDLPLWPHSSIRVGLGVWNSIPASVTLEGAIFGVGLALYWRFTRARDKVGQWSLGLLAVMLVGLYLANLVGPPPPSAKAVAIAGLGAWVFVPWGYWIDRHRELRQ